MKKKHIKVFVGTDIPIRTGTMLSSWLFGIEVAYHLCLVFYFFNYSAIFNRSIKDCYILLKAIVSMK